ncbi:MAG: divergent polysaccharide deacetylase family protein [Pelagibaca sp.]
MARGFLSGAIWGTLISVGGLSAASIFAPAPTAVTPPAPEQSVEAVQTAEPEPTASQQDSTAGPEVVTPEASLAEEPAPSETASPEAPDAAEEEAVTPADAVEREETPVEVETATEAASEPAPEAKPETTPVRRPADVTAVTPDAGVPVLDAPSEPQDTVPTETTAAPVPTPDTGEEIAALDAPAVGPAPTAPAVPGTQRAPGSAGAPALDVPQSESSLSVSTEPAQPPAPPVPPVATPLVPEPETTVDAPDAAADEPVPEAETGTDTAIEAPATERPSVRRLVPTTPDASDSATAALSPAIGTPAASLTERSPGNSARLPSIGAGESSAAAAAPEAPLADASLPALQRFAAPVDSDPDLPKMSIVMIDDGTGPLGPDTLDGFPFPVTFALDPTQPGAAERMTAYRALGYEVAALVGLPAAAQPSDVEQILGGAIAAVPEAVALIEAPEGGLQADRSVTEQATRFAADSGHGLVFLPNGLNTAQAIAQRETVPALSILRDFDGEGQDARTKRRFLDGAAFRARRDGAVVMLGRLTPDTLSALVLWSLQDRASSVAMVPVSTLLLEQSN